LNSLVETLGVRDSVVVGVAVEVGVGLTVSTNVVVGVKVRVDCTTIIFALA
jgi:hypothetical protein